MHWLDKLPLIPLALGALVLGLAPWVPEPHLWQKLEMLANGRLHRTIDIADLFMHASLPLLLSFKLARIVWIKRGRG
jgi:hypothetical protein